MILLDQMDKRPIYEQIVEKLSDLMIKDILQKDTPLPSVRSLASELSINPNTVQRAYVELEHLGYIYSIKGKGSFVSSLSEIRAKYAVQISEDLMSMIREAKQSGISEERCLELVHRIYQSDSDDNSEPMKGGNL